MMNSPVEHYLTKEAAQEWTRIAEKHRLRDEQFLRGVARWFRPGSILEIGAATGHLSVILYRRGRDVLASDYSPALVEAIKSRGVPVAIVDATKDIRTQTNRTFANVLAQNVLPLIWRERSTVCATLAAIHAALEPGGRLVCISAHAGRDKHPESYFTPHEQIEIARTTGLFRLITAFPHQVIPTGWYRSWNARLLNVLDFHAAHLFSIRLVWVMEKIDSGGAAETRKGFTMRSEAVRTGATARNVFLTASLLKSLTFAAQHLGVILLSAPFPSSGTIRTDCASTRSGISPWDRVRGGANRSVQTPDTAQ